jgi:hypothetical protein
MPQRLLSLFRELRDLIALHRPETGAVEKLLPWKAVANRGVAVLLLFTASGPALVAGAVLQVAVLVMYLVVSSERIPAFEAWGISLKVLQTGLLVVFVAMLVRQRRSPHNMGAYRRLSAP